MWRAQDITARLNAKSEVGSGTTIDHFSYLANETAGDIAVQLQPP